MSHSVLSIVTSSFFLDSILLTIFVPIIPEYLQDLRQREELYEWHLKVFGLFVSKAIVQLLSNLFVGPLTNTIGYRSPLFAGCVVMLVSTIIFAFGRTYPILFLARAIQGLGSSCLNVSGMAMLAERYPDDKSRPMAMTTALGGMALGVLIGLPLGGIMNLTIGKTQTFLVLACLIIALIFFMLLVLKPFAVSQITLTNVIAPEMTELLMDPYILVAAGALALASTAIGMLESNLPIWVMQTMNVPSWQRLIEFLTASVSYLVGIVLCGPLGHLVGRWLAAMIGLVIVGICLFGIAMVTPTFNQVMIWTAGFGLATGAINISMKSELANLVDKRHGSIYGSVFAIGDAASCLGLVLGRITSRKLLQTVGFEWIVMGVGLMSLVYSPFLFALRVPTVKIGRDKTNQPVRCYNSIEERR